MAVQKMVMMNLVAKLEDLDYLLKKITLSEKVHIVNAIDEIDESNFTLSMMEQNVEEIVNMCTIEAYHDRKNFRVLKDKMKTLLDMMQIGETVRAEDFKDDYPFDLVVMEIEKLYESVKNLHNRRDRYLNELDQLNQMKIIELLSKVEIDLSLLHKSRNFHMVLGTLSNEDRKKLSQNYENVPATIMHLGHYEGMEALLVVTPMALKTETDRILRSVHFSQIELVRDYITMPEVCLKRLYDRIDLVGQELKKIEEESMSYREAHGQDVKRCYSRLIMEEAIGALKDNIAMTKRFFYFSGWIAEEDSLKMKTQLESDRTVIIDFKQVEEVGTIVPPTLLKNNRLLKPFETLVEMYGTPSYDELDPTAFLGISYLLLFGAMFGDLGQGLVLALAGWLMARGSKQSNYGRLLIRMGISSSIFGFFYDSLFGYEHLISGLVGTDAIFIRPIENINTILSVSILMGIVLLLISLGYSIFNKLKAKDYQEGLFGRNGISGLVLYGSLLAIVSEKAGLITIGTGPLIGLSVLCVALIVIREPLANYMAGHKELYHEGASAYYVESGFDILETFLSMLSNSVSFIRVGAFALNHVGLFIAFHTMAKIIGNAAGEISMFIIGNLLVIFLEGLIVFIQGLRLVYYEMFSKYYTGAGKVFEPVCIEALDKV
jgi:V/A-type H+-transporting ATPase subunit I